MHPTYLVSGVCALALCLPSVAHAFAGEDMLTGGPWHHADCTIRGLHGDQGPERVYEGAGFSFDTAMAVAWFAENIDSYLYSPLFWARGGDSERTLASLRSFKDLAKLHFDDSFTTTAIEDDWVRYTSGTLIGLKWAADNDDHAAAYALLGFSSHAIQDFYAHSNWMDDPTRWRSTWFSTPPATRRGMSLYTGAYETRPSQAPAHHGAYSASCTLLQDSAVKRVISVACEGASPFAATGVCVQHRVCKSSNRARVALNYEETVIFPATAIVQNPRGIAMDNTWLAQVGGRERGLLQSSGSFAAGLSRPMDRDTCDAMVNFGTICNYDTLTGADEWSCSKTPSPRRCGPDADYLFAQSKHLATRSTEQWMSVIEREMIAAGPKYAAFWRQVKQGPRRPLSELRAQVEDASAVPYQFIAAGPYPIAHAGGPTSSHGTYLRLDIGTANEAEAGTDSDIVVQVDGAGYSERFTLDMLPTSDEGGRTTNRLLVHDDFERGSRAVYTVGPLPRAATSITLINEAPSVDDLSDALWASVVHGVEASFQQTRRALIKIIGGQEDEVGGRTRYLNLDQMAKAVGKSATLEVDGGPEGAFGVRYAVHDRSDRLTADKRAAGWTAYAIEVQKFACARESTIDRLSSSDEPFFFFTVSALNGRGDPSVGYWGGPFKGIDSGDVVHIDKGSSQRFFSVELPPAGGGLVLALEVFESDSESEADRRELWTTFIGSQDRALAAHQTGVVDVMAAMVAPDWKLGTLDVYQFERGVRPRSGPALHSNRAAWIAGGASKRFPLSSAMTPLSTDLSTLHVPKKVRAPRPGTFYDQSQLRVAESSPSPILSAMTAPPPWQGTWTSDFGELRLRQSKGEVFGDYSDVGTIVGTYDAATKKLEGVFTNGPRRGTMSLTLSDTKFSGTWAWTGQGGGGSWSGSRSSTATPQLRNYKE